jgi:hypothetical protein
MHQCHFCILVPMLGLHSIPQQHGLSGLRVGRLISSYKNKVPLLLSAFQQSKVSGTHNELRSLEKTTALASHCDSWGGSGGSVLNPAAKGGGG